MASRLGLCLVALTAALSAAPRAVGSVTVVEEEVASFLTQFYSAFALSGRNLDAAIQQIAAGLREDFEAMLVIPSRRPPVSRYNKAAMVESTRRAFVYYQGKPADMRISGITVLTRSTDDVVAQ